jgi:radical SAM superfamily enzyme YgiQ (UPF0313 family)
MSIKKVLLVDPPFFRFMGERQSSTPLGLAYLAGALKQAGFDVTIYNADFEHREQVPEANKAFSSEVSGFDAYRRGVTDANHPLYSEVVDQIAEQAPDLIGITVKTGKFFVSKTLIGLIKDRLPDVPIVVGGNHVTADAEHTLRRTRADFAVHGEGERTLVALAQGLSAGDAALYELAGLSFRRGGELVHNAPAEQVMDLDEIPFPDRDCILHSDSMTPNDFGNLFASRGCPFACTFCDSRTTWTRRVRRRSAANVVDEMVQIKAKYGTTFFSFSDDCFVTKLDETYELCDEIDRRGLSALGKKEFRFWCEIHPNLITEPLVRRLKKSGCVAIAIGAESGSQRTLDHINKASSTDVIRNAARAIKACDVDLTTFFMIGFPWENEADIGATVDFMAELNPDSGNLSILTPLPGTPVYDYCAERGLVKYDEDFLNCFHQRSSLFVSDAITADRSREIITGAFQRVDQLIEGNRRAKIQRTLERVIAADSASRFGLKLAMAGGLTADAGAADGPADGPAEGADVTLSCDQDYASATIDVSLVVREGTAPEPDLAALRAYLSAALLNELPQYAQVQFAAGK